MRIGKTLAVTILLGALGIPIYTRASVDRPFGLGLMLGEPTGISVKYWASKTNALSGGLAWSLGKKPTLQIHSDYLFHKFDLIKVRQGSLPIYFGIGGKIRAGNDSSLGVRIPVGLDYLFEKDPLDIFVELAPGLDLVPATDFAFGAVVGVRYFF